MLYRTLRLITTRHDTSRCMVYLYQNRLAHAPSSDPFLCIRSQRILTEKWTALWTDTTTSRSFTLRIH